MSVVLPETQQQQALTPLAAFGGLTLKQSSFIDHFLTNPSTRGNGTKSVIAAGYTANPATAAVIASQLLRSLKIKQEIKRRLGIAVCSSSEVLELLSKHARADLTDVLGPDGSFDFTKAKRKRLLKKLKTKKTTRRTKDGEEIEDITHEYEIHDPQAALDKLGRFYKLFSDQPDTELSLTDSDIARLSESLVNGLMEVARRRQQAALPVASSGDTLDGE